MIIRLYDKFPERFEHENRYCPICGDKVKKSSPLHRCSEKKIKNIEAGRKGYENRLDKNDGTIEEKRDFGDKLEEAERMRYMDED